MPASTPSTFATVEHLASRPTLLTVKNDTL
jgi:hypothetical protein